MPQFPDVSPASAGLFFPCAERFNAHPQRPCSRPSSGVASNSRRGCRWFGLFAAIIAGLHAAAATASPFPTRDQNPLLAGYGLPTALSSRLPFADSWDWSSDFNWASSAIVQHAESESLLVDAETREVRFNLTRSMGERWAVQLQLPYRYTGAGNLDSFIDSWHDFFSLPEGHRSDLPRDQFRIRYERNGVTLIDADTSSEGLADVTAALGYQWVSNERTHVSAWLTVDLPTGNADKFNGNGSTDVSLALAGEQRLSKRWTGFAQAAVTHLGDGDLFGDQQRSIAWSGLAGVSADVWRGLELKMQVDAHTAVIDDSTLDYLNDAVILTVGGAWKFKSGWQLDLGVSEDIAVETSPDVVFVIGVRRTR